MSRDPVASFPPDTVTAFYDSAIIGPTVTEIREFARICVKLGWTYTTVVKVQN